MKEENFITDPQFTSKKIHPPGTFPPDERPNYTVKQKFKTPYNSVPDPGEINTKPSETIPDQSLSIPEIIRRFASGLPLGGAKVTYYDEEDDILDGVDPRTLDISEKYDLLETIAAEKKALDKKFLDNEKELKKSKLAADKKAASSLDKPASNKTEIHPTDSPPL
jgi:hypothetical protein